MKSYIYVVYSIYKYELQYDNLNAVCINYKYIHIPSLNLKKN